MILHQMIDFKHLGGEFEARGKLFAIYVAQQLGDEIHKLIFVNTGLAPKRVAMKAMQQMQINRFSKFIKKIGMRMLFSGKLPKWLTSSLYFTDDTPEHVKMELSKHMIILKKEAQNLLTIILI